MYDCPTAYLDLPAQCYTSRYNPEEGKFESLR